MVKRTVLLFIALCLFAQPLSAQFARSCEVEIQSGQITGTLTDYRTFIYVTHNDLRTVGNGGYVQDAQGDDIRLYNDAELTSVNANYVKEFYDGTTGFLIMHGKISSLAVGGKYYLAFGNASLTTDGSNQSGTFGSDYGFVMPLGNGTSLSVADISGNGYNGTNNGATVSSDILSGGADFDGTNDYIQVADNYPGTSLSIAALVILDVNNAYKSLVNKRVGMTGGSGTTESFLFDINASGQLLFRISADGTGFAFAATGATTISTGAIHVVHATSNAALTVNSENVYLDGTLDGTVGNAAHTVFDGNTPINIGDDGDAMRFFNGRIRGVRTSGTAWSAAWVEADANAWGDPAGFASYTCGAAPSTTKPPFVNIF